MTRVGFLRSPTFALGLSLLMLTLVFVGLGQARSPRAGCLTRVTTASESDRGSFAPVLSADGKRIAFQSDSDFLGQGIPRYQEEIWLYDTKTVTLSRVTTASDPDARSGSPSLSADGTRMAFHSTADFLDQGIPYYQYEIWLCDTRG